MVAAHGRDIVDNMQGACGKRCWNKFIKETIDIANDKKKRKCWHNDGAGDGPTSVSFLIDWLSQEVNYSRWRGGDSHSGEMKRTMATSIIQGMKDASITTERTVKDVLSRIASIEQKFRNAADWLAGTGAGVEDEDNLKAAVAKRCPWYYELVGTMGGRASTQPLATERDMNFESEESDSEDSQVDLVGFELEQPEPTADIERERTTTPARVPVKTSKPLSVNKRLSSKKQKLNEREKYDKMREDQMRLKHERFRIDRLFQVEKEESDVALKRADLDFRKDELELRRNEAAEKSELRKAQLKLANMNYKYEMLMNRQKLIDAGVNEETINQEFQFD